MIFIVVIIGFILRIIGLNQSFWLDEAINVLSSKQLDLVSFLTKYPIGDFHPPGYFALLWIWSHLFGFGEINIRLLSVFLGIGTIILIYLIGKKFFSPKTALLGALLLALSPLHIYYSQEARMYSLSAFSAALCFYFFLKLIQKERFGVLGYTLSLILVLYSDYVTFLVIPAQVLYLLILKEKLWGRFFLPGIISLLAFTPWLFFLPGQIIVGQNAALNLPEWRKAAGGADFKNLLLVFTKTIFGRISFDNKIIYGALSILSAGISSLVIVVGVQKVDAGKKLLLCWLFIPVILAFLISFYIPMLAYFRMVFILPAFYLLLALGLNSLNHKLLKISLITFFIILSLSSLLIFYQNPKFQREDWRSAVKFIESKTTVQAVVLFEDNHVKFPYLYYAKNTNNAFPGLKKIEAKNDNDVVDLTLLLKEKKEVYLFEYLVEITDPNRLLEKNLVSLGFLRREPFNFNGVGFVYYYTR